VTPRARATLLLYAAVQFVVLTAIAMRVYAGGQWGDPWSKGYAFFGNFLSDLGATRAHSGHSNTASMMLFSIALATLGLAFIAFAGTWHAFAFGKARWRAAGIASQWCGTASGAAFVAVALTPVNRQLAAHNTFVVTAFAALLLYTACITAVWVKNGAGRAQLVGSVGYLLAAIAYGVVVMLAVRTGVGTQRGIAMLVVSQKVFAYASMVYVVYVTLLVRRQLRTD
jgi:hypothetical protein